MAGSKEIKRRTPVAEIRISLRGR